MWKYLSILWIKVVTTQWLKMFALCFLFVVCFYFIFLNYTEPTEIGISRNLITGNMWSQETGGWHMTSPLVFVSNIDIRPVRVAVTSSGHGYSAKLAQYQKDHWREFIATEGFYYHWWANRISFNFGYDEEYRGMKDIMRGYAYSVKKYDFIKIITEYQ